MIRFHLCALSVLLATAGASSLHAQRGKPSAPVDIASDPLVLKQDEQGTLTVRVVALAEVDRMEIVVGAGSDVELLKPVPTISFSNVKTGERHNFQVGVRLTSSTYGLVSVVVTTTKGSAREGKAAGLLVGTRPPAPARVAAAADEDLSNLTLVKLATDSAVVRFGNKALMVVSVGDRLGKNKAEVIEIGGGRMVLDEIFTGADGKPNRARVTLKEGEKGGTRVQERNDEEPPQASRTTVVDAKKKSGGM